MRDDGIVSNLLLICLRMKLVGSEFVPRVQKFIESLSLLLSVRLRYKTGLRSRDLISRESSDNAVAFPLFEARERERERAAAVLRAGDKENPPTEGKRERKKITGDEEQGKLHIHSRLYERKPEDSSLYQPPHPFNRCF